MTSKPTLLLDMDGPLAGFDLALWEFCIAFGVELDIANLDDPKRKYFMTENMVNEKDKALVRLMIDKSSFFRNLPVTPGAQEGVKDLEKHFDVWVCTKPLDTNISCRNDKMAWIERNFPDLYNKVIMAPVKSMVTASVLLDDAPIIDGREQWHPIVFTDTFNIHDPRWQHLPHWTWSDGIDDFLDWVALA